MRARSGDVRRVTGLGLGVRVLTCVMLPELGIVAVGGV